MKKCTTCKKCLPDEEFRKDKSRIDGLDCRCRQCGRKHDKERRTKQKQLRIELRQAQNGGRCAICKSEPAAEFAHFDRKQKYLTKSGKRMYFSQMSCKLINEEKTLGRGLCRLCHLKETAEENKQIYLPLQERTRDARRQQLYYQRKREYLLQSKLNAKSCKDCGRTITSENASSFDFDHLDASKKLGSVAQICRRMGWQALVDEITKCEVICHTPCHENRTRTRKPC